MAAKKSSDELDRQNPWPTDKHNKDARTRAVSIHAERIAGLSDDWSISDCECITKLGIEVPMIESKIMGKARRAN